MTSTDLSTRPTLRECGLDFRRYGYFTRPMPHEASPSRDAPEAPRWLVLQDVITQLSRGDFSALPVALECFRKTDDWRLKATAARVLGDAGTVECFREMRAELEQHPGRKRDAIDVETREVFLLHCRAFAAWGRLDVVPVLMDQYLTLRLKQTPEIEVLPLLMAELLAPKTGSMIAHEPPEDQLENYLNLVMNEYESLSEKLGSTKVLVYRGAAQSVRGLAGRMRHLVARTPSLELARIRARFEPATGIDCSGIFEDGQARTLAAAELAEQFLEDPRSDRFEDGARYFFGHRVPGEHEARITH